MESDGKSWQVVKGKPGGTKKPKTGNSGGKFDGNFAPTVKTESAFSAFAQEQDAQEAKRVAAQRKEKADASTKKDEREIRPVRKATSIEEALAFLDAEELERTFKQTELMCPDRPAIWMNDIATQLGTKLNIFSCDPKDPMLTKKQPLFPLSGLSEPIARLLDSIVVKNQEQTERFYETATNLLGQGRGSSACWEYRLFIQLILRRYPQFAVHRLDKTTELLRKCTPHATETSSETAALWCVQQALRSQRLSLRDAFALVHNVLLNFHAVHSNKQVAYTALTVADAWLTELVGDRHLTAPLFSSGEYFAVFDALFQPPNVTDSSKLFAQSDKLREKAERFFTRFQQVTIFRDKKLSPYFSEYLPRLRPDSIAPLICSNLLHCLLTDTESLRDWRRLFASNVLQSCTLLDFLRLHQVASPDDTGLADEWGALRTIHRKELLGALSAMRNEARSQILEAHRRAAKKLKQQPKATNKRHLERVDEEDALVAYLERALELIEAALNAVGSSRSGASGSGAEYLSRTVACMYLLVLVVMFVLLDYAYARFVLRSRSPRAEMVSLRIGNAIWSSRAVQTVVADLNALLLRIATECRKYPALDRLMNVAAQQFAAARVAILAYSNQAWKFAEPYLQSVLTYDYAALFDTCLLQATQLATTMRRSLAVALEYAQAKWATLTS